MKRSLFILLALALFASTVLGRRAVAAPGMVDVHPAPATIPDGQGLLFPVILLDNALDGRVDNNGRVDYPQLKGDQNLAMYVQALAKADLTAFPTWEIKPDQTDPNHKNDKPVVDHSAEVPFWINAYNSMMLKTLADAYPLNSPDSIRDLDTAQTHVVAGKTYSFKDLRGVIAALDPRALFAITDGTLGGPEVSPHPYYYYNIDRSLNLAVSGFINDDRNVHIDRINNKVTLNDYFETVNNIFAKPGDRDKYSGARVLLTDYSGKAVSRDYFVTQEFSITFDKPVRNLNVQNKD